ncbi:MAG: hypothetical protein ABI286_11545 [Edaphobacter sp.]
MDVESKKRLHWLMYGLYYPAVLGTAIVVTLQHAAASSIKGPALAIATTAGAFFSLSFASAMGLEKEYRFGAFALDFAEVLGMFVCFAFLELVEFPAGHHPVWIVWSPGAAYGILLGVVLFQLWWRKVMGLRADSFLDLKLILCLLLVAGIVLGEGHLRLHWLITAIFALIAWLYVSHNPYRKDHPVRRWFFGSK